MKCEIGVGGELVKTFDVAGPQACRLGAAMEVIHDGKPKVDFKTTNEAGAVEPAGTGTAVKAEPTGDGRSCATVTLANGKSGNICSVPSMSPGK